MKSGWPSGQALFCSSAPAPDSSSSDAGPLPTPLLQAWSLWGQQPAEGRARLRQSVSSGLLPGTTAEHKRSPHPLPRGLPDGWVSAGGRRRGASACPSPALSYICPDLRAALYPVHIHRGQQEGRQVTPVFSVHLLGEGDKDTESPGATLPGRNGPGAAGAEGWAINQGPLAWNPNWRGRGLQLPVSDAFPGFPREAHYPQVTVLTLHFCGPTCCVTHWPSLRTH